MSLLLKQTYTYIDSPYSTPSCPHMWSLLEIPGTVVERNKSWDNEGEPNKYRPEEAMGKNG
jgi:hypothetical protein